MSTTVTAAPLTYTFSESITLVGEQRGSSISKQVHSGIKEYSRIVRHIGASAYMTVAEFASAPLNSGSQFDLEEVKYIRITNLDTNHDLAIALDPAVAGNTIAIRLEPGHTFMMGSPIDAIADSETLPFRDLEKIRLRATSTAVDAEIVVGSI
tara:strand:+ start:6830 stop:7288 length:459 start_codon:yes stop_codon:yes gene_type:complete